MAILMNGLLIVWIETCVTRGKADALHEFVESGNYADDSGLVVLRERLGGQWGEYRNGSETHLRNVTHSQRKNR